MSNKQAASKGSGKKLAVIAAVALCLALAAAAGTKLYLESGSRQRGADPEGWLNGAIDGAKGEILRNLAAGLDFGKFTEAPLGVDFSTRINNVAVGDKPLGEIALSGSLQLDRETQQMVMDATVGMGLLTLSGNRLYVSPSQVALSVPTLYSKAEYITVDPANLPNSWNDSFLSGVSGVQLPGGVDYGDLIASAFDGRRLAALGYPAWAVEQMALLRENAMLDQEGTVNEVVGGDVQQMDIMTRIYSPQAVQGAVSSFLQLYIQGELERSSYSMPSQEFGEYARWLKDTYGDIRVEQPVQVRYIIDRKQRLVRVEVKEFEVQLTRELSGTLRCTVYLEGEEKPTDSLRAVVGLTDSLGYGMDFQFGFQAQGGDTTVRNKYTFQQQNSRDGERTGGYQGEADLEWTPDKEDSRNMRLTIGYGEKAKDNTLELTAILSDDSQVLSLQDATLSIYQKNVEQFNVRFSGSFYPVEEEDRIVVDTGSGTDVGSISMLDMLSILGNLPF